MEHARKHTSSTELRLKYFYFMFQFSLRPTIKRVRSGQNNFDAKTRNEVNSS